MRSCTRICPNTHHHVRAFFSDSHPGLPLLQLPAHPRFGILGPLPHNFAAQTANLFHQALFDFIRRRQFLALGFAHSDDRFQPFQQLRTLAQLLD